MSLSFNKHPWVNVAVFENLSDGQILETYLTSRRLEARAYNDKALQLFLFLCPPRVTFRVQVRSNAFMAVKEILENAPEATMILQRALHCPSCGSFSVQYPQMTRKFFLPTVLLHLGIVLRIVQHEAYCEDCHHVWNLPQPEKQSVPRLKVSGH